MSLATGQSCHYSVGGSLEKGAVSYVVRQADQDLYQTVRDGNFGYVLDARQVGKSSLRVRTMQRLQSEGIACAVIDISSIGSHGITTTEWYLGIVRRLSRGFGLRLNVLEWWAEQKDLAPAEKLAKFFEDALSTESSTEFVVFIDEIDSITHLEFKDDFFALIRSFYERRSQCTAFQRLTFVCLGVAIPSDLVGDRNKSLFDLGTAVQLKMLQLKNAAPLAVGLQDKAERPEILLEKIFSWTNGQPFLTQRLCLQTLITPGFVRVGDESSFIEQVVYSKIIKDWEIQDRPEHLVTIQDRILRNRQQSAQILHLYRKILEQGQVPDTQTLLQQELLISGLVRKHQGYLQSTCRTYSIVFNAEWIGRKTTDLFHLNQKVSHAR
ncbi:MAG: AAA-like domain-containing protein [Cyanobacteria bacterium J06623_5]